MVKRMLLVFLGMLFLSSTLQASPTATDPVAQALKAAGSVVVFFTKNSCPFCVWLRPLFSQLQTKGAGVRFLVVDVGSNPSYYRNNYRINTVPTVIYFNKNGKEVARHGSNNKKMSLSQMQQYLRKAAI